MIQNTLLVFTILIVLTTFALYAERMWKWASFFSSLGICTLGAVLLTTCKILPTASAAYDVVYDYVMPLAIPMLLLNSNIKRIIKESGRMLIFFHVSCAAAVIGSLAAGFIFRNHPMLANDIAGFVAMEVGVCTGGVVNQMAMANTFHVSESLTGAAAVSGNIVAVIFLVVVGMLPSLPFLKKHFTHPHMDEAEAQGMSEIVDTTKDIRFTAIGFGKLFGVAFGVYGLAAIFMDFVGSLDLPAVLMQLGTNMYLIITVITVVIATVFPKQCEKIPAGDEICTFFLLVFMAVIGAGANLLDILKAAPFAMIIEILIVATIVVLSLLVGKLAKIDLEEILICCNASYGGPNTAVAYVAGKGWRRLVIPGLLVGIYGLIIGNVLGILAGNIFGTLLGIFG